MEIEIGGLEVLLKEIPYHKIELWNSAKADCHTYNNWSEKLFKTYAGQRFHYYNENETSNALAYLKTKSKDEKDIGRQGIFQLISKVSEDVLNISKDGKNIEYKFQETLRWRTISLYLGGDIFVAEQLAKKCPDRDKRIRALCNRWKPSISTHVKDLEFGDGLAENHFHLQGSSKSFELNWISLMNYVLKREKEFKKIPYLLKKLTNDSVNNEKMHSFAHTVYCAALYRLFLFLRMKGDSLADKCLDIIDRVEISNTIGLELVGLDDLVQTVRAYYRPDILGEIDYAIPGRVSVKDISGEYYYIENGIVKTGEKIILTSPAESWRALIGERFFLTECMRKILYDDDVTPFGELEKNIFYRYLVMKNCFRSEIIQVNRMVGFQNFSNYQDRKRIFIKNFPIYEEELVRLALNASVDSQNIVSLEARLCPEDTGREMCKRIKKYNDIFYGRRNAGKNVSKTDGKTEAQEDLFYVLHFPKEIDDKFLVGEPRHARFRNDVNKKCCAIKNMLNTNPAMLYYVRGIDACANEIGCRPEVFAVYFRDLLNTGFTGMKINWNEYKEGEVFLEEKGSLHLYATYHAGEDFLDIVDGLRAIDEAVLFCNLKKGCRIGHALALGITPYRYYQFKHNELTMPKQDLLDDLVWLYCKAKEYRFDTIQEMKGVLGKIKNTAEELLEEIYCKDKTNDIARYYLAWKLRGDNPDLYDVNKCININTHIGYELNREVDKEVYEGKEVEHIRKEKDIVEYYYRYHFDEEVRKKGAVITKYKVPRGYGKLVELIQNEMMKMLIAKGIAIECNPSSNYLIGTFERYDEHPIVRFNAEKIQPPPKHAGLQVSINTDDQGVFETSLENEYYLMLSALEKVENENGGRLYYNCKEWLQNVAMMGREQAFRFEGMSRK